MKRMSVTRLIVAALLAAVMLPARSVIAGGDWNDQGIQWQSYADGMAKAKASQTPVCLIFYTEWCPHCQNYSKLFHLPAVVEQAKQFVMIRLDADKNRELGAQYSPDGGYIPRTFFLSPDGELDTSLRAHDGKFQYFFGESDSVPLLTKMAEAQKKYRRPGRLERWFPFLFGEKT